MKTYKQEDLNELFGTTDTTIAKDLLIISVAIDNQELKRKELDIKMHKLMSIDTPSALQNIASKKIADELNNEKIIALRKANNEVKPEEQTKPEE